MLQASDILPTLLLMVLGTFLHGAMVRRAQPWEVAWLWLAFVAHVAASVAQIWVVRGLYGFGDQILYHNVGMELADALRSDFLAVAPQVLLVLFQQPYSLSVYVPGGSSPTSSMCAFSGIACFLLNDSLYGINLFYALGSYFGQLALYRAMRSALPAAHARWLLTGVLLTPSTVFWSSGLVKEAIALAGTGPFLVGVLHAVEGRWRQASPWIVVGAVLVSLVKPYILMVLLGASGVLFYWRRAVARGVVEFRPLTLMFGAAVAVVGVLIVGQISPRFSIERLGEETGRLQGVGSSIKAKGGSMYMIGTGSGSLASQILYAPLGLLTALYRPMVLEARNPQMLASALENAFFLVATAALLFRRSLADLWATTVRHPFLAFCLSFTLVLGVATGLTSANLGSLSRYRMPVIPFFTAALVTFWSIRQRAPQTAPSRVRPTGIPATATWDRPRAPRTGAAPR